MVLMFSNYSICNCFLTSEDHLNVKQSDIKGTKETGDRSSRNSLFEIHTGTIKKNSYQEHMRYIFYLKIDCFQLQFIQTVTCVFLPQKPPGKLFEFNSFQV